MKRKAYASRLSLYVIPPCLLNFRGRTASSWYPLHDLAPPQTPSLRYGSAKYINVIRLPIAHLRHMLPPNPLRWPAAGLAGQTYLRGRKDKSGQYPYYGCYTITFRSGPTPINTNGPCGPDVLAGSEISILDGDGWKRAFCHSSFCLLRTVCSTYSPSKFSWHSPFSPTYRKQARLVTVQQVWPRRDLGWWATTRYETVLQRTSGKVDPWPCDRASAWVPWRPIHRQCSTPAFRPNLITRPHPLADVGVRTDHTSPKPCRQLYCWGTRKGLGDCCFSISTRLKQEHGRAFGAS